MTAAAASYAEKIPVPTLGRRVLVAEDSPTTHEILKLLLSQRGHHVDIATDGEQALAALRNNVYDIALLDFHLPKMDGLQVANAIRQDRSGRAVPRLVAITADVEGLLSHPDGCDNVDQVLPKPLDIYQIARVVEDQEEFEPNENEEESWAPGTVKQAPARAVAEEVIESPFEDLGLNFLSWPGDIDTRRLSARAMQATLGDPRFDGILMKVPASIDDLTALWRAKALYVLPIIDLTGTLGRISDLDGSKLIARDADQVGRLVRSFEDRRAHLHRDILFSADLDEQLLGRMYVSNRALTPNYDPNSRMLVSYDVTLSPATVIREAKRLCDQGLLRRQFFERFHVCPRCDSHRLNVREECINCRSSDLSEEQYLHHFRCAYQGPEAEFRRGDQLVCPKCRHELTHFGFDYDRPGTMVVCQSCSHSSSEPAVGFACVDCGAHSDSEVASTRDIYAYELTDQGVGFAEHGHSLLGSAREALRFADLPIELVVALNGSAKRYNEAKTPFTLINISYRNEREVTADYGARAFSQARDLFIENLRSALAPTGLIVRGLSHDFALLPDVPPEQAKTDFDLLMVQAENALRHNIGPTFKPFGPEDFS